jgi:hypothetical protein
MRPTYYVEYDEVDKTYGIFVTDYDEGSYDYWVADFENVAVANSVRDCMNDVMMRVWGNQ